MSEPPSKRRRMDASLRSFIEYSEDSHFPIQNLPFGIFRPAAGAPARPGVAIGDQVRPRWRGYCSAIRVAHACAVLQVLDLSVLADAGLFTDFDASVFSKVPVLAGCGCARAAPSHQPRWPGSRP